MRANLRAADPRKPVRHARARVEASSYHPRDMRSAMNVTTYGFDLAEQVFRCIGLNWTPAR